MSALALIPHVSASLASLCLVDTYNAQGPYILRKVTPEGKLPALRSLGIHLEWENMAKKSQGIKIWARGNINGREQEW